MASSCKEEVVSDCVDRSRKKVIWDETVCNNSVSYGARPLLLLAVNLEACDVPSVAAANSCASLLEAIRQESGGRALYSLSDAVQSKLRAYLNVNDAKRSIVGQLLARFGISLVTQGRYAAHEVELGRLGGGKPIWEQSEAEAMDFNISHVGQWVICCVLPTASYTTIGCDVSSIEVFEKSGAVESLLSAALTKEEALWVKKDSGFAEDPAALLPQRCAYLWTHKEAVLKGMGVGLQADLQSISVCEEMEHVDERKIQGIEALCAPGQVVHVCTKGGKWHLGSWWLDEKHICAVALRQDIAPQAALTQLRDLATCREAPFRIVGMRSLLAHFAVE